MRNVINVHPVSRLTPSPQGRQTLQASVVHRSSVDNGQPISTRPVINNNLPNIISESVVPRNVTQSPRSPSSADILEVMPLYPRSQNATNQVTNVYQLREFKREHNNNNQSEPVVDTRHVYSNDLNRDLAILRNTLRQETVLNTMRDIEDETRFLESRYLKDNAANNQANENSNPLSPTLSTASEHYAQLSLEQQEQQHHHLQQQQTPEQKQQQPEPARLYMNIIPNDANVPEYNKNDNVPTTPLTPKQIEYCNISVGNRPELITYANLIVGELGDSVKNVKLSYSASSDPNQKFSESDTFASMSPVEEVEVNYAVLDIDNNKDTFVTSPENKAYKSDSTSSVTQGRGRLKSQCSVDKPGGNTTVAPANAIGYTTIDFDKTVALTSVAAGEEVDVGLEGSRKTRHNSCNIICGTGSPGNNEKK